MKALVIIIIQLFVFQHPIFELLKLKFARFYINVIAFEYAYSKFPHQVMNVCRYHLDIILSHFYFHSRAFSVTFFAQLF